MSRLPQQERSLVLLKPDAVQRSLVGEIIKRFEQTGLKIAGMKMIVPTETQLLEHYNKDDAWYERKGHGLSRT
jgi:Nucleoside diphosphate kinase